MRSKILTADNYLENFNFQEQGTGAGIEQEPDSGESYLFVQTYLPKSFLNIDLDHRSFMDNPFIKNYFTSEFEKLPDKIFVKFELFGIGSLGDHEAYIFKPWVIGIDNPSMYYSIERFHLYFPSTLFYNLIERLIFLEELNQESFRTIRVLQDLHTNSFQRFGLDKVNVKRTVDTSNLIISRIENPDKNEISEFYRKHWAEITSELEHKYFRPLLNTWFRVTLKSQDKTIGFVRLYNSNISFTGGTSIEYIIDTAFRNKGYATESLSAVIELLKKFSYAISLGCEENYNNQYSVKVLKKLGFTESKPDNPLDRDNFSLSLLDTMKNLETSVANNSLQFSVQDKYANKYKKYF